MNRTQTFSFAIIFISSCLAFVNPTSAQDSVQRFNAANRELQDGNVDKALQQYLEMESLLPETHLLDYNKGIAFYRKGDFDSARLHFTNALNTDDSDLAAKSSFNLGNCEYSKALKQTESDVNSALASLHNAIDHYRSSLQSNPSDVDSRSNIELANQLLKKLKQQQDQEQQDQQQPQDSQDQESAGQENQKSDSENNESENSDSQDRESNGGESENDDSGDEASDREDKQESGDAESQEKPSEDSQSAQDPSDNTGDTQQPNSETEKSDQKDPGQQPGSMDSQDLNDPQPQSKNGPSAESENQQPGELSGKIDKQEAMKMLQAIRDRDLMRRSQKLREKRRRRIPVDRDW